MKSQSFLVRVIKHQIEATIRLIKKGLKEYILQLLKLENQLEEAMAEQIKNVFIKVDDMIAAGKKGYVAKIENGDRKFLPTSERTGYGHSRQVLTFEIPEDGIYEVQDANFGGRLRRQFIKIESSKIVATEDSLNTLLASEESDLPELEGSQKQIDWAFAIRENLSLIAKKQVKKFPQEFSLKSQLNSTSIIGADSNEQ